MIPPVKRTATGLKVVIWYKMLCHFTHFTSQWKIQMFRRVNYYPLLFLRKVSIHPSFNEWQIHRFRTSLSSLGYPWAYGEKGNEGEEVHVQGQPEKIRPLSDLWPCTSYVTASTFSVLPRQRPCFDVIRLDNWGDVVDLARKHGNHRWDLNTTGSSGFRALPCHACCGYFGLAFSQVWHGIITTRVKELVPTSAHSQKRIPGSRPYAPLARYDF